MLYPAEFGALAAVNSGAFSTVGYLVETTGDQVLLAREARHSKRLDDVGCFKLHTDVGAHRDVNFIRCGEPLPRTGVEIVDLPPPLEAPHPNREVAVCRELK